MLPKCNSAVNRLNLNDTLHFSFSPFSFPNFSTFFSSFFSIFLSFFQTSTTFFHFSPCTDTRMIMMTMTSWILMVVKNSYTSHCHVLGSIYHNSKQPLLRFSVVKALFFKQVTLYSNWKSYWSSRTLSVVPCSNTYINL